MDFLQAVFLSIVEGITEFLPISSTGHLILTTKLLGIPQTEFVKSFEIIIQLGAICAVLFLYWRLLLQSVDVWKRIIIAFIPTAIFGFVLYKFIKTFLIGNEYVTLAALFIGGIMLIVLELIYKEKDHHVDSIQQMRLKTAFFIGCCQAIAMIPGVSRSAATIIGGLFLGTKRKAAVEFSFLLAIPTMFAATVLDIKETAFSFTSNEFFLLGTGFIGSFLVAIIAIKLFLRFIQKHTFIPFGIYRILAAILYFFIIMK